MKVQELRLLTDVPVITADTDGFVTWINERFREAYGWTMEDLVGKPLPTIIPSRFHDAHHSGFARFLMTRRPTILERPLELLVLASDGREIAAQHVIVATETDGRWEFAAIVRPVA